MNPTDRLGDVIGSRRNPLVRRLHRLEREADTRHSEGVFLLGGWKVVQEALREPSRVERILVGAAAARQPAFRALLRHVLQAGIPTTPLEDALLREVLPGAGDQGVVAVVRMRSMTPGEMVAHRRDPLLLLADRIQDPGNLGSLIRLAEAARVSGVLLAPGTVDPHHPRAARASAGSILRVPLARIEDPRGFRTWARGRGVRIAVTLPEGGVPCHRAALAGPLLVVFGNEGAGIAPEWESEADLRVTVSLGGEAESLNVATAAAILLYEILRQREGKPDS